ncbi:peptide deformylase [Patescibacteria group bacterium]
MKILTNPNPVLRKKSVKYNGKFDIGLQKIISQMFEIMKANKGIGLAAPQIGKSQRIIVARVNNKNYNLINPEIIRKSPDLIECEEGCLSVPKTWGKVQRSNNIKVRAYNQFGKKVSIKAENLLSVVLQHEIDHLNGILFIDKVDTKTIKHTEPKNDQQI